jgi:sulfopropanediol 3-dehydrogenase
VLFGETGIDVFAGPTESRISRYESMEGHARAADIRLRKYFPDERFDFEVYDQ